MRKRIGIGWRLIPALVLAVVLTAGCGPPGKTKFKPRPDQPGETETDQQRLSGQATGLNWHIPWFMRDPKHPKGKPIPVLVSDSLTGAMDVVDQHPTLHLGTAHVKVFKDGLHSADVDAANLVADQRTRIVSGSGGVKVTSLTQPPDTVVTADTMVWNISTGKIVAVGHATLVQTPHHGNLGIVHSGGKISFDTSLKKIDVEAN